MSELVVTVPTGDAAQHLISVYGEFITEIFKRLEAISASVSELKANPQHPNGWQNCDFCWFQIRKICEYLALGIVAAHYFDGNVIENLVAWRPKELLGQAAQLNAYPTPVPIAAGANAGPDGEQQLVPLARPIRPQVISAIYGRCSELLHAGSLERILEGNVPAYDLAQLDAWLGGFWRLLENHVLLLPGIEKVLVCRTANGKPTFFAIGAEGEASFDTSALPDFEFG